MEFYITQKYISLQNLKCIRFYDKKRIFLVGNEILPVISIEKSSKYIKNARLPFIIIKRPVNQDLQTCVDLGFYTLLTKEDVRDCVRKLENSSLICNDEIKINIY